MPPEPQPNENLSLDDALATVVADLPLPVQRFVTGERRGQVVLELSQKHRLHVDQAGEFERAFILMLLGLSTPDDFIASLEEAGIDATTVNALVSEVNEKVFKPLREEERNASRIRQEPSRAATPVIPPMRVEVAPPSNLPGVPTPVPVQASVPVPASPAASGPIYSPPVSQPVARPIPQPLAKPLQPPVQKYANDPYREPVE